MPNATQFATEIDSLVSKTTILAGSDPEVKRQEILAYFHQTFSLYERLFESLACDEAYYDKAIPLRHPLIFYFGHTAVFYVNKLRVAKLITKRLDPTLEAILAIGVDEMSWDDLDDNNYEWPTIERIRAYRDEVREVVDTFIRTAPLSLPVSWNDPLWIVMMGIEHERIHLETSTVLMRQLPVSYLTPDPIWPLCPDQTEPAPDNALVAVAAGTVTRGKPETDPIYGWDNEYGKQIDDVPAFRASRHLVSNKEYFDFVEEGGYQQTDFWTEEGAAWLTFSQATHPEFWVPCGDTFRYRAIWQIIDMPWSWPVDVNYLEAKAFCNWKSAKEGKPFRLPTEPEWVHMRNKIDTDQPHWKTAPGNLNLEHWASACPVDRFEQADGLFDVIGNVWQWTETPIDALPGYRVHPAYDDFSTPTFDGQHNLIKGGSYFSTGNCAIHDSRYAFRRHFFQHAGFRYIQSDVQPEVTTNLYETDALVSQYVEFHYGDTYFNVPNYPKACADACLRLVGDGAKRRALDLGCAVGRTSFELAKHFQRVDGLDFSARFINVATKLQEDGCQRYTIPTEGDLQDFKEAVLADLNLAGRPENLRFMQGDACNLPEKFTNYDLVFAGNLIDRLYHPARFLDLVTDRIAPGGILVLTSPYTWLSDITDRENWLGGIKINGENQTTLDTLQERLSTHFEQIEAPCDIPFVIRETQRKYQHTIAQLTAWRKR